MCFFRKGQNKPHTCKISQNDTQSDAIPIISETNGVVQYSQCRMYNASDRDDNATIPCANGYDYGTPANYWNSEGIVSEVIT